MEVARARGLPLVPWQDVHVEVVVAEVAECEPPEARRAETFYEVVERFDGFALLRAIPKTGRTHQIRVHLNHAGCPVLCDRLYGGRAVITRGEIRGDGRDDAVLLDRQALHARRLRFVHPESGQPLEIEAAVPRDMEAVLAELRAWRGL